MLIKVQVYIHLVQHYLYYEDMIRVTKSVKDLALRYFAGNILKALLWIWLWLLVLEIVREQNHVSRLMKSRQLMLICGTVLFYIYILEKR